MKDLRKLIMGYLQEAKLMQLATSYNNQPWVCSVWFAVDDKFNIYWFSSTTRRHSHEVIGNEKVAAAIVLPQTPEDAPRGLQLQGVAELVTQQEDIDMAISVFADRIFSKEKIKELMENAENPHSFYKIRPTQFVLFDAIHFPDNPRQELKL